MESASVRAPVGTAAETGEKSLKKNAIGFVDGLAAKTVTTDADGNAGFRFRPARRLPEGDFASATATALAASDPGSTSELSAGLVVSAGP